jgi:hypothetical protein
MNISRERKRKNMVKIKNFGVKKIKRKKGEEGKEKTGKNKRSIQLTPNPNSKS